MNKDDIIKQTEQYVRETLSGDGSGHDWWHVYRVWKIAVRLAQQEGADVFVVELAALLHDIADYKFYDGDDSVGPQKAREWLERFGVEGSIIEHVCSIIKDLSFKGAGVDSSMATIEGKVVQDADRLDAIGAIGIARTFAYGGSKGREMYNPDINPVIHQSFDEYKKSTAPTINHFHEKLLLLKDLMNTGSARAMAEGRHVFMEQYLNRFSKEWEGEI